MNLFEIKEKVQNFVLDDVWVGEFLLDCLFNTTFSLRAMEAIEILSDKNLESDKLDKMLNNFKKYSKYYLYKYKKSNNVDDLMNAETYWMFIELATNNSILTKNIQSKLIAHYGNNYLKKLSAIDNLKKSIYYKSNDNYLPAEKNYICVKKWQDVQHIFVSDGRLDYLYKEMDKHYTKLLVNNTNFNYKFTHYLSKLLNNPINSVDDFTKLYLVYPEYDYNSLIGGKAYGLVRLRSLNVTIPETYFINDYSTEILKVIDKRKHYAIRSSADIEDGNNHSFAGIFDSVLNVKYKDIKEAVDKVKQSISSERAKNYYNHIGLEKLPTMHLVLQHYIDADYAGVWMGDNKNIDRGILEYVKGCGDKLVSGQVSPSKLKYNNNVDYKNTRILNVAKEMINTQKRLNLASDIEWCLKGKKLYYLQARYVTTNIDMIFNKYDLSKNQYAGSPGAIGKAIGRPILLNSVKEFVKPLSDEILLTWFTDPEWVPIMKHFKGVITAVGGFLSHAAIICREMNIPCVVEMDKTKLFMLKDVKKIEINGETGTIKVLER